MKKVLFASLGLIATVPAFASPDTVTVECKPSRMSFVYDEPAEANQNFGAEKVIVSNCSYRGKPVGLDGVVFQERNAITSLTFTGLGQSLLLALRATVEASLTSGKTFVVTFDSKAGVTMLKEGGYTVNRTQSVQLVSE